MASGSNDVPAALVIHFIDQLTETTARASRAEGALIALRALAKNRHWVLGVEVFEIAGKGLDSECT